MPAGTYDAKLKDVSGRICIVRNIKVEAGADFLDRGEGTDVLQSVIDVTNAKDAG